MTKYRKERSFRERKVFIRKEGFISSFRAQISISTNPNYNFYMIINV